MNNGSRTIDELRSFFPFTIQCLDQIIAEGVTLESLLNVLNNLNGDAENKFNNGDPIGMVANESKFGEELYGYLAVTDRILAEKKNLIYTLPNDIKREVTNTQNAISETRKKIKDIIPDLRNLEKNNDILSKEKKDLENLIEQETIFKNEQSRLEKAINELNANDIGDIDQLKKKIAGMKKEQEGLLQQKNELIRNSQREKQNLAEEQKNFELERDKAKKELDNLEKENKNLEREIRKLDGDIVQRKDTNTKYISRIDVLKKYLQSLQKDELERELRGLLSNAETLLGSWAALSTDTDVKEYFNLSGDTENDIFNLYRKVNSAVNDLKGCIEKQEKAYKVFLPEWEKKYE